MYGKLLPVIVVLAWGALTAPVQAEKGVVAPDNIHGTVKVDAEGLIDLVGTIPDLVIIDARIRQDRAQGFIEDSISLPDVKTDCVSLSKILPGKSSPVLFYCNGVKCVRSGHSSRIALGCGYNRVYWFRGGFEEWKDNNYPFVKD
ncbi:MAG: rhodanese-like domain-containing protein [Sulfuricaulis sp.]|nr:rhodanese-like domain-containing protein [Sulfuricaulis sp.]